MSVCVDKFAKVNQRLMTTYVECQTKINDKRMKEYEQQLKDAEALATQQQQEQEQQQQLTEPELTEPAPVVEAVN